MMLKCIAFTFLVGLAAVYGSDAPCHAQSGSCQDDTTTHCSGSYMSGLCSGGTHRRCCIPHGTGSCSNVHIVSRAEWGARAATHVTQEHVPVSEFFIHHTETGSCYNVADCSKIMRSIQHFHMDTRGWSDIGYSFLIGEDGKVYEGRGWEHVGAHTQGYNSKSFAASFMGSYMTHKPGAAALQAVKNLISCGIHLGKLTPNYRLFGHRDAGSTDCPGNALYNEIQTWPHYSHSHP